MNIKKILKDKNALGISKNSPLMKLLMEVMKIYPRQIWYVLHRNHNFMYPICRARWNPLVHLLHPREDGIYPRYNEREHIVEYEEEDEEDEDDDVEPMNFGWVIYKEPNN